MFGFAFSPTHAAGEEVDAKGPWHVATTHEKSGQLHFATAEFSEYKSKANYTKDPKYSTKAMDPVYNFTRYLFGIILPDEAAVPPGE